MDTQTTRGSDSTAEHWDTVIEPRAKLLDLNLAEVWRYRDLLWLFVKRDFVSQYKQTILGPLWHFIQPIFTTVIYMFIFGQVAGIPTDGIDRIPFYMSGIAIWNYFSSCLTATSSTFVANANIFGKVYFPRLVIPLSSVMSNIVKFGIQFFLLLVVLSWFGVKNGHFHFGLSWLLIPLLVLMMAGLGLGMGIIISSLTTKYRDFNVLIGFAVQLLMYATPVAYPLSYLKDKGLGGWVAWNPLSPIVEAFRYSIFGVGQLDVQGLLFSGTFIIIVVMIGLVMFSKVERSFMDTV
ncbi:ABC transporter permease [Ferruginibacter sp. HRS2-29]|uniref:ABC transporter permease n=1 Tax=Ferruginibacter sp. HRS2-29 TaxID=2487334 RepID=UPI0020CE849B|nr:ABC transporter permease [Ferruginibacter sp. HRS2-29]MCP9751948.1 ABC transporter permease [Ferruginibacter sp. HRS2-29]